ncbi:MAG: YqgE/AlgH family protein [Xanthomonadales bacterium]|nr:YqgE/AlgH family protein [Xanthomonadales bacterium]
MRENGETRLEGYLEQQLLIAMPSMLDPNFERSVTLMCQHTEQGAIGITINRRSEFSLGEIFKQLDLECSDPAILETPVLEGGPVNPDRGFVLHTPVSGYESSMEINPAIMVTTSRDVLVDIARGEGPEQFIMALGYAGWGDGQLESELRENAWLSVPADSAIVYDWPFEERWQRAFGTLGIDLSNLHGEGGRA